MSDLGCPVIGWITFREIPTSISPVWINNESSNTEEEEKDEKEERIDGFDDAVNDIDEYNVQSAVRSDEPNNSDTCNDFQ